ncbi:type II toxin-antitoxin system YafQ family toxin, partial [Candidatus Saccharibacteria bacterium]|nr:type II toxin-antitoxin system YafQ family toxin [Candidatus Saccharibacteria bacterium]
MLKTYFSTQFRKDLNKVRKRGLNTELLDEVILMLAAGKTLPSKYKDHALKNSR